MTYFTTAIAGVAIAVSMIAQAPKVAKDATATKGPAALQGTWGITSINDQPAPEGAPEMTLTFSGDKYNQTVGSDVNERGTIKVDASKKPMTIDLIITEGQDAGKTQLGIFEITGQTMRANLAQPGAAKRPEDFAIKPESLMFVATKKKT